ncbi:ABC transporter permease [Pelovirga terrestris]|uniref:ABC transporter permease n=1 Tax=Pelovirga terrestris TaxID=2771352 RepID=A0A8J6QTE0_9BACT|nr:ABC transporter permease [Pelovirga terrestris]MBD1401695.1 ABC transporter permease [Pelovirga terrestris]
MTISELSFFNLALAYLMFIVPLAIMMWLRLPMISDTLIAMVRMTLQLLFVGFYLQVVFKINSILLTGLWLLVMIVIADLSIVRSCGLRLRAVAGGVFISLLVGTLMPLLFFVFFVFQNSAALGAQYVIPISGMILGNCLRADIVGMQTFYESLRRQEKAYIHALAQGAGLMEALLPFVRKAFHAALAPTVAAMATIGLVALPGMMTGVILAGGDPMTAIKYQIAIMIAIFTGTALTVLLAIFLTIRGNIGRDGLLKQEIFADQK